MAKILLYSLDKIGKSMAGPAIRYFEIARILAKTHDVVLMTQHTPDIEPEGFRFASIKDIKNEIQRCDIYIAQQISCRQAFYLTKYKKRFIVDAYDPQPLEHLEIFKALPLPLRDVRNKQILAETRLSFKFADGILCANEQQRDLWLGFLMNQGLINPARYDQDPSLKNYLAIVPFGLGDKPPEKKGMGLREKFGLKQDDKVLLWGGGIWNWFDPLSLIKGIHLLSLERDDIKLVFMGLKHPNDNIQEMQMSRDAVRLSEKLGLTNKHVFFNFGWTPYEERQAFLMEADIGVSTHLNHLETRYAFRTRMLDYLWASLPILCTKGDSFAALIEKEKAGVVVTFECEEAIKRGILEIVDYPEKMKGMEESSSKIARDFTWSQVTKPLLGMIEHLSVAETFDKCHKNWISTLLFMRNPFRLIKSRKAIRHMQAAK